MGAPLPKSLTVQRKPSPLNPEQQVVRTAQARGSLLNNSPQLKTTQTPTNRQMDKQNVVFLYNSTLLGNKKEWMTDIYDTDAFHTLQLSRRSQIQRGT